MGFRYATLRIAPGNAVRTDMRHINSVFTYQWCTFQLVWLAQFGFRPAWTASSNSASLKCDY